MNPFNLTSIDINVLSSNLWVFYLIAFIAIAVSFIVIWLWIEEDRKKDIVYFVKHIGNTYQVILKKKIPRTKREVKVGDRRYMLSEAGQLWDRGKHIYLIDYDEGSMLKLEKLENPLDPQELDSVLSSRLMSSLFKGPLARDLVLALMALGLGLALGYIIGNIQPIQNFQPHPASNTTVVVKGG